MDYTREEVLALADRIAQVPSYDQIDLGKPTKRIDGAPDETDGVRVFLINELYRDMILDGLRSLMLPMT